MMFFFPSDLFIKNVSGNLEAQGGVGRVLGSLRADFVPESWGIVALEPEKIYPWKRNII